MTDDKAKSDTECVFAVAVDKGSIVLRADGPADLRMPQAGKLLAEDGDGSKLTGIAGASPAPWEILQPIPTASVGNFGSVLCMMAVQISGKTTSIQGWLASSSLDTASGPFFIPLPNAATMESTLACMNSATYQPLCAYLQGGASQLVIAGPNRSTPAGQGQTVIFGGVYNNM